MKRLKVITLCILLSSVFLLGNIAQKSDHINLPHAENYITAETESTWLWPTPSSRHITSFFGKRTIALYGYERQHTGIDINAATGADVLAAQSGTVVVSTYDGGWGNYIIINHGNNLLTLYAHMNSRTVERGDSVVRGQVIGKVGNTGISSAPHLHFELRENGKPINPFHFAYYNQ